MMEDVWLRFRLRYYRQRLTLRGEVVKGISQAFGLRKRPKKNEDFWALRGLSLQVAEGDVLGIIGPNGAGKSTLLRVMAGIYAPDRGKITVRGNVATLLSLGAGFDGRRPGRENIYKNGTILGLGRAEIDARMPEILDMAGLGEFIDAPVMTYSSGMRARLGFSIAVNVNPDVLLIDEVLGAGDEKFRHRVGNIFDRLSRSHTTVVFVTHSLSSLTQYCSRAVWVDHGVVHMQGSSTEVAEAYLAASKSGA